VQKGAVLERQKLRLVLEFAYSAGSPLRNMRSVWLGVACIAIVAAKDDGFDDDVPIQEEIIPLANWNKIGTVPRLLCFALASSFFVTQGLRGQKRCINRRFYTKSHGRSKTLT
jgi:hypothetical protein